MTMPTLYQKVVMQNEGFDPNIWWVVDWGETSATIKNRATNELVVLNNIEGFGVGTCRNIAGDEDDPVHGYIQQI